MSGNTIGEMRMEGLPFSLRMLGSFTQNERRVERQEKKCVSDNLRQARKSK